MPSDASIYSLIQQQKPISPIEAYGGALQLKSLIDQQGLQSLQRQQLEKGIADEDATSQAYREAGGDASKVRDLLYGRGLYKPAQAMDKVLLERREKESAIGKNEAERALKRNQLVGGALISGHNDPSDENLTRIFGELQAAGIDTSKIAQSFAATPDPDARRRIIQSYAFQTPEGLAALKAIQPDIDWQDVGNRKLPIQKNPMAGGFGGQVNGVQPLAKAATPGEVMADARARNEGKLNRATTERGQDMVDQRARDAAAAKAGQDAKLTESQGKATGLALRAQTAHDILTKLEDGGTLTPGILKQGVAGVPLIGGGLEMGMNTLPTWLGGPNANQQKVEQAQRDFVNAALRVESGASISASEFENARRQYFPQPGDSKEVIAQKRRARETEIQSLKIQGGPGAAKLKSAGKDKLGGVLTQNADGSFNYGF